LKTKAQENFINFPSLQPLLTISDGMDVPFKINLKEK